MTKTDLHNGSFASLMLLFFFFYEVFLNILNLFVMRTRYYTEQIIQSINYMTLSFFYLQQIVCDTLGYIYVIHTYIYIYIHIFIYIYILFKHPKNIQQVVLRLKKLLELWLTNVGSSISYGCCTILNQCM